MVNRRAARLLVAIFAVIFLRDKIRPAVWAGFAVLLLGTSCEVAAGGDRSVERNWATQSRIRRNQG